MLNHPLRFLVLMISGWMNRRQQDVIAYLQEENRVLRERRECVLLSIGPVRGGRK